MPRWESAWEDFFVQEHLEDVYQTGCFTGYAFRKTLEEDGRVLFSAEYYCHDQSELDRYNQHYASRLKQDVVDRFEGRFTAGRRVWVDLLRK